MTASVAPQMTNKFADWYVKTFYTDTEDGKQFFDSEEDDRDAIDEDVKEMDC